MTDLKHRPGDQPLPVKNDAPDIQSQVIADIEERRKVGISRYGTALQPHNGRDALRDLYEELLDGAMYVKQAMVERDQPIPGVVLAEMRGELQRKDDLIVELRRQLAARNEQVDRFVAAEKKRRQP
jgi:hypothetical protein